MSLAFRLAALLGSTAALMAPAAAQDYGPYGYGGGGMGGGYGFDWDGFYAGVYGGGVPFGETSLNAGVFTGVNVSLDPVVVGVEAQLGGDFADDTTSFDALVLGKGGMSFGDALVYATGGVGVVSGDWGYAVGGGAEYGFTDYMSVRGEVLGTGDWGGMPDDMRVTAGVAFHM